MRRKGTPDLVRGRRPYSLNQRAAVFGDSRLKRGVDSDAAAIEEQLEDLEPGQRRVWLHDVVHTLENAAACTCVGRWVVVGTGARLD